MQHCQQFCSWYNVIIIKIIHFECNCNVNNNYLVTITTRCFIKNNSLIFYYICQIVDNFYKTRGSAIAEEPRDALRQLKYYGRFLTELLTRSSANPEQPCEHNVSWNRAKSCTNVRRIACENVCNRWMTFKVIQGHCRCHHLIGHILFPISLPL